MKDKKVGYNDLTTSLKCLVVLGWIEVGFCISMFLLTVLGLLLTFAGGG